MKDTMQNNEKKYSRKKYIIPVVILLCILAGYIYMVVTCSPMDSESAKASEAVILKAAALRLDKDPNNLTNEDFMKVTQLAIPQQLLFGNALFRPLVLKDLEISDIKILEKFTSLQSFFLRNIKYPKTAVPKWMTLLAKVGIVNINERFTIDLSPLKKLSHLEYLDFSHSPIKHIEPLGHLKKLRNLDLSYTYVSNLEPIKNRINLEELNVGDTKVCDLEPLRNLKNLEMLDLSNTKVRNIEHIKNLTNLQLLVLMNTDVSDIEPIKSLEKLRHLFISRCDNISDEQVRDLQKAQGINFGSESSF